MMKSQYKQKLVERVFLKVVYASVGVFATAATLSRRGP